MTGSGRLAGRLAGRVAVVTGGTAGIGRASVLRFVTEGARVMVGARSEEAGARLVAEVEAEHGPGWIDFLPTDVSRSVEVRRLVDRALETFGDVDVLFANAGTYERGTVVETDEAAWRRIMDVDVSGVFHLVKHGLPHLESRGGGSVILTASELGLVGTRASVAYCAAKGAIVNMTRALAVDCAGTGIRVNCLAPGPVDTALLDVTFNASPDPAAARRAQLAPVLLGRFGRPEEIASVAVFLASDDSSFMTGSVVVADGGVTSWYGF